MKSGNSLLALLVLACAIPCPARGGEPGTPRRQSGASRLVSLAPVDYGYDDAYFSTCSDGAIVDDLALRMSGDTSVRVVFDGYSSPGEGPNLDVDRVERARNYLVFERGVDPQRVVCRAFGTRFLPKHDWVPRERVEITLLGPGDSLSDVPLGAAAASPAAARPDRLAPPSGAHPVVRLGHVGGVSAVAFAPDGRAVTGSEDGGVAIWDSVTGAQLGAFEGHAAPVSAISLSPDARLVLTASLDGTASVWDAATGAEITRLVGHDGGVLSAMFSADGKLILTAGEDGTARLWRARDGAQRHSFADGHDPLRAALSPDAKRVATASAAGHVRVSDAETGAEVTLLRGHALGVTFVAFTPDGERIVTAGDDHTLRVWSAETGAELRRISTEAEQISCVGLSPDGRFAIVGGYGMARGWDLETGDALWRAAAEKTIVRSAAFSPDGQRAVLGMGRPVAIVVDAGAGTTVRTLKGTVLGARAVSMSTNGRVLAVGLESETVAVWDVARGSEARRLKHSTVVGATQVSPDGRYVLGSGWPPVHYGPDESLLTWTIWDASTGGPLLTNGFDVPEKSAAQRFELTSYWVDGGTDNGYNEFVLSDTRSSIAVLQLSGKDAELSPDGRSMLVAELSGRVAIWSVPEGGLLHELAGLTGQDPSVSFSRDGRYATAESSSGELCVWEASTGTLSWREKIPVEPGSYSTSGLLFSADGRLCLTGATEGSAPERLRRADTGAVLWEIPRDASGWHFAKDLPGGRQVLSSEYDHEARTWTVGAYERSSEDETQARAKPRPFWEATNERAGGMSPDARRVVTIADDGWIRMRDAETGRELWASPGESGSVSFSGNGRLVLVADKTRALRFLDAMTGVEVARVYSFEDGTWVALDPRMRRFDAPNGGEVAGLTWPAESLRRELYRPGLLPSLLAPYVK